jgi:hypothetical protein
VWYLRDSVLRATKHQSREIEIYNAIAEIYHRIGTSESVRKPAVVLISVVNASRRRSDWPLL